MKPTIIDVATAAGVSKSTVSLVLQDSPLVKAATREAVRKAMADLGYVYNAAAAGLRERGRGRFARRAGASGACACRAARRDTRVLRFA